MEKRRSVMAAILLGLPLPGLGQLYCGRTLAALVFGFLSFSHWLLFGLAWVVWRTGLDTALWLWGGGFALVWIGSLVHAGLWARRIGEGYRAKPYNLWSFYLVLVIVAWAGHFGLFRLVASNWLTSLPLRSDAMTPGLLAGDVLRVDRRSASLAGLSRGAVVAVVDPLDRQTWRVLRVVGLPGETVEWSAAGLSIDGRAVARQPGQASGYPRENLHGEWAEQRYLLASERLGERLVSLALDLDPGQRRSGSLRVPPGHLLVLGDNRIHAQDSRAFGPLPIEAVEGVVMQVWFSRDPQARKLRPERSGLPVP